MSSSVDSPISKKRRHEPPEYSHPDPTKRKRWTWEAEKDYLRNKKSTNEKRLVQATKDEEPWSNSHLLNFQLSKTRIKQQYTDHNIYQCLEVNCLSNAQGGCKKLCRKHYSEYMICTKQVKTWECVCGEVVMEINNKCGKCHRWKT